MMVGLVSTRGLSVSVLEIERRNDARRPEADDDSSRNRVAFAELLGAIGSHMPGGDPGCGVQQLPLIL